LGNPTTGVVGLHSKDFYSGRISTLNIVTTPREDHQMEMLVEVEAERMEAMKRRAARKIAEKAKIPGFRPGKAPYEIVVRNFGEGAIIEQAIELLVDEIYPEALKEANIEPGGMGQLENVEELDPPKFKFLVPLSPTVELGDYAQVRYPYEWQAPPESEVDDEIQNLRRMYAQTETVEREVQEEDYVLLDVVGKKAKAAEDEEPLVERNGFAIVIRAAGKDDEFPFAGFAKKLIGLKPGESKNFSHKYPKGFSDEKLAGQSVSFDVTIKTVRAVNMPELDDEFAKKTGMGETVEELRQRMNENIQRESQEKYDDEFYTAVMDKIMEGATIKYPPQVLEHEAGHVVEDVKQRLARQGMDFETYLKVRETSEEKFMEEEAHPVAIKRLERGLVMDELSRAENVKLDEDEVKNEVQNLMMGLMYDQEFMKLTKNGKKMPKNLLDNLVMDAANRLTTRKVLERVKLIATGQAEQAEAEEKPAKKAKKAKAESTEEGQGETKPAKKAKKAKAEPASPKTEGQASKK
jgi:trigger factor